MLFALGCLGASIFPARFDYIAREPALLDYTRELIRGEQTQSATAEEDAFSAVAILKGELARQYALATDHNRRVNNRRERWRSIAGLAALASVLMTIFVVAATYAHYLPAG